MNGDGPAKNGMLSELEGDSRGVDKTVSPLFAPGERMAKCKRKTFGEEWEAVQWVKDNPGPFPAPPMNVFQCHNCKKFHITDKPLQNGNRRRRGAR